MPLTFIICVKIKHSVRNRQIYLLIGNQLKVSLLCLKGCLLSSKEEICFVSFLNKTNKMLLKSIDDIPFFKAGDDTILKEVLHPDNDGIELGYSIAFAKIEVTKSSLPHRLKHSETYIFLKGSGQIYINDATKAVKKGDIVYVPPMANQYVENTDTVDLEFYCIVSPAWREDEEYVD